MKDSEGCSPAAVPGAAPMPEENIRFRSDPSCTASTAHCSLRGHHEDPRLVEAGGTSGVSWSNPLLKQGHPEPGAQDHAQTASEHPHECTSAQRGGGRCKAPVQRADLTHTTDFHREAQPHRTSWLDKPGFKSSLAMSSQEHETRKRAKRSPAFPNEQEFFTSMGCAQTEGFQP